MAARPGTLSQDARKDGLSLSPSKASAGGLDKRGAAASAASTATKPIGVPGQPKKTTTGFGSGSVTKILSPDGEIMASSTPTNSLSSSVVSAASIATNASAQPDAGGEANVGPDGKVYPKKPKGTKEERRKLQEAQRAAKEKDKDKKKEDSAAGGGSPNVTPGERKRLNSQSSVKAKPIQVASKMQVDDEKKQKTQSKRLAKQQVPERVSQRKQVTLFSHLKQYERSTSLTKNIPFGKSNALHPAFVRLGLQMSEGRVSGSSARCIAMMHAFCEVIKDYVTPQGRELQRDLNVAIQPLISYLAECRPLSTSMGSAIKFLKHEITHELNPQMTEEVAKQTLVDKINRFVKERIELAQESISGFACKKIKDGDVLLIPSSCDVIFKIVSKAAVEEKKKFKVIVVDSRPKMGAVPFLRRCLALGIPCSYILMTGISYVIHEVTKVIMSANSLLANGYVMGRVGSSMVAMMAHHHNVPVLVCCETYKFCDRVQTDSFVFNELGDPDDLAKINSGRSSKLANWHDVVPLTLLNLVYDVTPPEFVDMVVTEIGMIPCTSVPVVLRVKDSHND